MTRAKASQPGAARVETLLHRMTLEDKVSLVAGASMFGTRALPQYGIPSFRMSDGPVGARIPPPSTAYAAGIGLAATWDTELAEQIGVQLGRDARSRGANFLLGPGVNIYKLPNNGRNFEYFGEDPLLSGRIAVGYIRGVQSQGVSATIKHYAANNSEFARHTANIIVDERALREIYLPAFEAAVKQAHVGAVMDSYNLINGEHATENRFLNTDVLRRDFGFQGVLMSDWLATYNGIAAANSGLDLEMPFPQHMNTATLLPALRDGSVSQATIDGKVEHILGLAVRFGWLDHQALDASIPRFNQEGVAAALKGAEEGIVLLKNEGNLLPLDATKLKRIAVIGPDAFPAVSTAGGSGQVVSFQDTSILAGLSNALRGKAVVTYARGVPTLQRLAAITRLHPQPGSTESGVTVESFRGEAVEGPPTETHTAQAMSTGHPSLSDPEVTEALNDATMEEVAKLLNTPPPHAARWTGYYTAAAPGSYTLIVQNSGKYRLLLDGKLIFDHHVVASSTVAHIELLLTIGEHKIQLEDLGAMDFGGPFFRVALVPSAKLVDPYAIQLAQNADAVVVAAGYQAETESEGADRSFELPPGQVPLIEQIAAVNKHTIVAITSGGSVATTPWLTHVPVLLEDWYPGQQGGTALAKILLGEVNPSGHLPISWEARAEDNPSFKSYYYNTSKPDEVVYRDGVFVGYRGYQHTGTAPLFPFGFGLSYTRFQYGELAVQEDANNPGNYTVSFKISNTGKYAGAAIPQIYVGAPVSNAVPRPVRELRGFTRLVLSPGQSKTVTLRLEPRAFTYFDVSSKQWRAESGKYSIQVGGSSQDLPLSTEIMLRGSLHLPASSAYNP